MKYRLIPLIVAVSLAGFGFSASRAFAQSSYITISSEGALAPNAYGSTSYAAWAQNAIAAIEAGVTTVGASGPTQFTVNNSPKLISDNIATSFPSWLGDANPIADFGWAYANEYGNRAVSDVIVKGNGTEVELANLAYSSVSSDPGDALGFSFGPGGTGFYGPFTTYDSDAIGIDFNNGINTLDGITIIDSGSASQPVNEIISVGAGDAYTAYVGDFPGGNQASIDGDLAGVGSYDLTTTWTYEGISTSDTQVFVSSIPDSGGGWMMYGGAGLGMVLFAKKQRPFKKGGSPVVPAVSVA